MFLRPAYQRVFKQSFKFSKLKVNFNNCKYKMSTEIATQENGTKRVCLESKIIGTHSGTFHCDEVLACYMLKQLPEYENAEIIRSRNDEELFKKCDIIVDVGGKYVPEKKYFDHHQKEFKETFSTVIPNLSTEYKIRLSSAGLIYAHYGERVLDAVLKKHGITLSPENLKLTFIQIYRNFIQEIDAIDNGVPMFENGAEPAYKISTHLSARIGKFNPSWELEGEVNIDECFYKAMEAVGKEFTDNVLSIGGSWIKAREYVRSALINAKNIYKTGEILFLERFCPWKSHLADLEKEYQVEGIPKLVIWSENATTWRIAGVPLNPDSFLGRKFLPVPWRGLRDEELSNKAGIKDLIFVHHTGFIGGAKSKEAAFEMAIKSVEFPEDMNQC